VLDSNQLMMLHQCIKAYADIGQYGAAYYQIQVLTADRLAAVTALCSDLTRSLLSMPLVSRCIMMLAHVAWIQHSQQVHDEHSCSVS
jgi:hypothetical protein